MDNLRNLPTKLKNYIKSMDKRRLAVICIVAGVVVIGAVAVILLLNRSNAKSAVTEAAADKGFETTAQNESGAAETLPASTEANTILALSVDGPMLPSMEMAMPTTEPAPEYLREGVQHESVKALQQRLMDLGYMDNDEPTDYYGPGTANAVIKYQRQNGLVQDGILSQETLAQIMSDEATHYQVKEGDEGEDIEILQERLYQLGYLPSDEYITGTFGEKTKEAVIKLQEVNGITADGTVGLQTYNLVYSDEVKANMLEYGEKSEVVLAAQKRLFDLGYMTSTPDGTYGEDTSMAIKVFQRNNALVADGYLGPDTRALLMSDQAVHNGLSIGDENDQVKKVQALLAKWGYLDSSKATGYYGEITANAVKSFQSRNNLSVDGKVGAQTLAKLTSDNVKRPAANSGSSSSSSGEGTSSGGTSSGGGTSSAATSGGSGTDAGSTTQTTGGANTPNTDANGVSGSVANLLAIARSKTGCPYSWGAKGPNAFDCSGFVYWVLNQCGVSQSYITSYGWRSVGRYTRISNYSDLRAGDIIVVNGHVGFVSTGGYLIDASSSNGRVIERPLGSWWANHFIVGWRVF